MGFRFAPMALASLLAACASTPDSIVGPRDFSHHRLDALTQAVKAEVDGKRMPGVVMIAARDGRVFYKQVMGILDPRTGEPMKEDAIFRIYSMTKPVVSLAALMLVEEGKLALGAPVSFYMPELKELQVGNGNATGQVVRVKAKRQPTVHDLLRHTAGFTYGGESSPVAREYEKAKFSVDAVAGPDAFVKGLASLPLAVEPGAAWEYGMSSDVLGVLIERLSGKPLDVFLRERIFEPLRMVDTAFWVEESKHARIAEPFAIRPDNKQPIKVLDIRRRPAFLSGGAGLVTTAADYLRFAQMMLNGGQLDGVRLVSRKTIDYMTSDHLGGATALPWMAGYGFGLGVAVRTSNGIAPVHGSAGDYWWLGYAGTTFWVDPKERLVAVFLTQAPGYQLRNMRVFRNMLYSAME